MVYAHLTRGERYQISVLHDAGHSIREIAMMLGRNASTISRELRRNRGGHGYRPLQAHVRACERARRGRCRVRINARQWRGIAGLIRRHWSPEQIAWRARHEGTLRVSPEWIYRFVYADGARGGDLVTHLRCRRQRRKRYGSGRQRRGRIVGRVGIEHRPAAAARRSQPGHWEADTLIGKGPRGALLSTVERRSRFVRLGKLARRTTQAVQQQFRRRLGRYADRVRTVTVDNGKEFAGHAGISRVLSCAVYFADPYASYQRGTSENTNGLIRQYLPKGRDLTTLTGAEIRAIEDRLNHRPRKCLGFLTPHEVFNNTRESLTVALRS